VPRKILHALLARCTFSVGEKLFRKVVPNANVAKELSSSRKASALAIVVIGSQAYPAAIREIQGAEAASCAAVKLAAATKPKFMTTRETIAMKIQAAKDASSLKRPRE
jgi:hypothetical protein